MSTTIQPTARRLLKWAVLTICIGGLLFGAAGRLDLPALWAFTGLISAFVFAATLVVDPELFRERFRPAGPSFDAAALVIIRLLGLAQALIAALDVGRFHWSDSVPPALHSVGFVGVALSLALILWAMATNNYFSSAVRIQHERGHHVVTGGPYRYARHPGYFGMAAGIPFGALLIGSWWGAFVAILYAGLIVRRAVIEERFLAEHLEGYQRYIESVRYRLVPGLW